ncbi:MAG: translation initiation factor IF-2 subunit alpha [Candidatus Bathyarchaeota archaeon]|jgi:translation initiation factor 2 subunit 1
MSLKREEWPERGDLVMATVENVLGYGAYVKLDEYNRKGLLHVSEISSSWIRNIRNFVREKQKLVLKVLRVNMEKEHIDLSLRRVTKRERIEKIRSWKQERKAETLLRSVAEKTGISLEEIYQKAGRPMEQEYGLYEAFEKAAQDGEETLITIGVPEDLAKTLVEIAEERIQIPSVMVRGIINLTCAKPNGVNVIKESFLTAKRAKKSKAIKFRFYTVASPKYRIEVQAQSYKDAESALQKMAEKVISNVTSAGGHGSFEREK